MASFLNVLYLFAAKMQGVRMLLAVGLLAAVFPSSASARR